jgi:hypothetical protein
MGLFSGFFERRRQRESAVPGGNIMTSTPPPSEEPTPVGQPVAGVGQPAGLDAFGLGGGTDVMGVLGMIKSAYETGNIQVSYGPSQTIDLRGDTDVEDLRSQIIQAMEQRGIDPTATNVQVDTSQYAGLQEDLLRVLGEHGIDIGASGGLPGQANTDGDGKPG